MSSSNTTKTPFGVHLMLDAYDCDIAKLRDANVIYEVLDKLPTLVGMTKMTKPYIVFTEGNDKKDPGGWSGFVLIEESHVSIHTFVRRKFFTFDLYSCKEFDTEKAIDYLKKTFNTNDVEYSIEQRGKRYPDENVE